jgi:hypothetical protein
MLMAVLVTLPGLVQAASMEIWPSERRANNTYYCYGNDWNSMLIAIYPEDFGKQRLQLPEQFAEPTVLTLTLPAAVKFLGANLMHVPGVSPDFPSEAVTKDGKAYQRIRMTLPSEGLTARLLKGKWYYHVFVWFRAPEKLDDAVSYELHYGEKQLAAGGSRLLTAGVVADKQVLPKRFGFYPYGIHTTLPNQDYDYMAGFLRRFGVSGIESHWPYGLPADEPTAYHLTYEANRRAGVKNIANMSLFASKYGGAYGGTREQVMKKGGLVVAMDESVAGLTSAAARADWQAAHRYFDLALWDWEPTGPHIWPGYDDPATIAAFAKAQNLPETLTAEQVQKDHREAYSRFRMEQIARPLYAMRQTIDAVKPIPLRIEQGSGATSHVTYDVYGHDFPALSPMIYQPSPLGYARNMMEMLANTKVPASKFWPDLTIGWPIVPVHRHTPEEYLLDTLVTVAAGCGSVSHWPGIHYSDATWFGIHEGLRRIAPVEEFYLDGQPAAGVTLAGVPYREEKIALGNRTLDHFAPDWRASLITFAHEFKGEQLLTLLNYHQAEDCFVRVTAPALRNRYLVNSQAGVFQVLDSQGEALVRVGQGSPGQWLVTANRARVARLRRIEAATVQKEYAAARQAFLASSTKSEVQLGTTGDLTVAYAMTPFGGQERVTLQVKTPTQTIAFGPSGGRVYDWQVKGMAPFVAGDTFGQDGLIMDMLWLPASARWSGDEVAEMTLVGCTNSGREVTVTYEGALKKGLPGVVLRKTYRIPAAAPTLEVEVTFRNERVDAEPVKLAYWSHNVFKMDIAHYFGPQMTHETPKGDTTIWPAEGLPAELRPEIYMPQNIISTTGPVYAEYFPQSKSGLIMRLPENFLNVYRWSHYGKPMCGSEWMSRPLSLGAGASETLRFSLTAVPEATPEKLQAAVAAQASAPAGEGNLLPFGFGKLNEQGLPVGWKVNSRGANPPAVQVTAAPDETGETVVKMTMAQEASVDLDLAQPARFDPAGDYMLVVQMKVEDLHHTGDWYGRPAGLRLYVYGQNDKHVWLAVHGAGSTKGWVTGVLPFPGSDAVRPHFAHSRVLLRCYNMTGTVSFRNPMIVRRPAGLDIRASFTLEDGTQVSSGALQLRQ